MTTFSCRLRFNTPAFLGDAEQSGAWRTPPIKALLRQFWRMDYARRCGFKVNLDAMRRDESALFGSAADAGESRQSLVRIRLDDWSQGKLTRWEGGGNARHPEVGQGGQNIDTALYLGYGPLEYKRDSRSTGLKKSAAIQANEAAVLRLATPSASSNALRNALALANLFGTLGGRSRNGWGSLSITPDRDSEAVAIAANEIPVRDWSKALELDWPHALGKDETGALVWHTGEHADWKSAITELAKLKIALRTQFEFTTGRDASQPESRHWISYPVTNHSVRPWGNNLRLPNSLRFKIVASGDGRLQGLVFHMPCLPPREFKPQPEAIEAVWEQVHRKLDDKSSGLSRVKLEELV